MSTPRFARGSKSRLFLYIGAITVAGVVVYFIHHAQEELAEYQKRAERCLQQQESLSAQFQVIIEYKIRLEKSLQQEKAEHRRLMEELQAKLDVEKQQHEKDNLENLNKYTSLQQQHKILQSHHDDLSEECEHLRVEQLKGLDVKSKLESALESAKQEVYNVQKAKEKEMQNLKAAYLRMEVENEKLVKENKEMTVNGKERNSDMNHLEKENQQLNRAVESLQGELSRCMAHSSSPVQMVGPSAGAAGVGNAPKASSVPRISSSPVAVAGGNLRAQVLQEPLHDHAQNEKISNSSPKSTTPQINPDAVLSREKAANAMPMAVPAPDTVSKDRPLAAAVGGGSHKEVGMGVGAAPPRARDQALGQAGEAEGDGGNGGEEGAGGEPMGAGRGGGAGGGDAGEVAEGEGALQAPNWGEPHDEIPSNHAPALAAAAAGFLHAPAPAPPAAAAMAPAHQLQQPQLQPPQLHPPQAQQQQQQPLRAPLMPAGVVPAPHGYGLDHEAAAAAAEVHGAHIPNGDSGVVAGPEPWPWRRNKGWPVQPLGVRDTARRRQLAEPPHLAPGVHGNVIGAEGIDEAEEREKEIPRQQQHNLYGEYNGDNGEYEKDRHGDLQLEEGEEEEDDDVDQIDYANENANGRDIRQKHVHMKNAFPNVNKHDSVMINPK